MKLIKLTGIDQQTGKDRDEYINIERVENVVDVAGHVNVNWDAQTFILLTSGTGGFYREPIGEVMQMLLGEWEQ